MRKFFCFWDNCSWIVIFKLSLLKSGYLDLAANTLTSSPKTWHVNKRDFLELNCLGNYEWIWLRCCDADFNSAWARLPCCYLKGPLKKDFLDVHLTTFSQSIISEIKNLWGSSFLTKYLKFNLNLRNAAKNWERVFLFLR